MFRILEKFFAIYYLEFLKSYVKNNLDKYNMNLFLSNNSPIEFV